MGSQEQIGKNLKKAREKAGLTQEQVAEKAGIHVNYYARIERGEAIAAFKRLEKIYKILKMNWPF